MSEQNESVASLREAIRVSPNNLPLREILANALLGLGRGAEAEQEYRQALSLSPNHLKLKAGLARAFLQQGKTSESLVLLESIADQQGCPPIALQAYARLLAKSGKLADAEKYYRRAVEADVSMADPELEGKFGGGAAPAEPKRRAPVPMSAYGEPAEETDDAPAPDANVERPRVAFKDVGGMEALKDEIRMKIIHPLAHPEMYAAFGKKVGGGILMYGPPGCGKTHLARATAGEIKASFMSAGISDVLDMWLGSSERNLHALFEQARGHKPCVLFFDEVDALAASRADMRHNAGRHLINQFLAELDGINSDNEGVLILAATNAPWSVDSAFRRPGRFDRILFVPPPDAEARSAIVRLLTEGKPSKDIDYDAIAKKTESYSGADLKAAVDIAIENKLKAAMKAGGALSPLTTKDLLAAAATVKPSTKEWFASARNYALYSNQGGTYDDILKYLKMS